MKEAEVNLEARQFVSWKLLRRGTDAKFVGVATAFEVLRQKHEKLKQEMEGAGWG